MSPLNELENFYANLLAAYLSLPSKLKSLDEEFVALMDSAAESISVELHPSSLSEIRAYQRLGSDHLLVCLLHSFIDDVPENESGHLYDLIDSFSPAEVLRAPIESREELTAWLLLNAKS